MIASQDQIAKSPDHQIAKSPESAASARIPSPGPPGEVVESSRPEGVSLSSPDRPSPTSSLRLSVSSSLPPSTNQRALLGCILSSHAPLSEIAAEFDTTVLDIAEWMELPHVQRWLALIERAATTRARVQAAEMRTDAVAALDRVLMESTCHTDRDRQTTQRTATALLRASAVPVPNRHRSPVGPASSRCPSPAAPATTPESSPPLSVTGAMVAALSNHDRTAQCPESVPPSVPPTAAGAWCGRATNARSTPNPDAPKTAGRGTDPRGASASSSSPDLPTSRPHDLTISPPHPLTLPAKSSPSSAPWPVHPPTCRGIAHFG